jgi:hypothetical protein
VSKEVNTDPVDRLQAIADKEFGSLSALATAVGRSNGYFHSYKGGKFRLGDKILRELQEKLGINASYIRTGQAEPLLDKPTKVQETQRGYLSNIKVVKSRPVKVLMHRVPAGCLLMFRMH